MTNVKHFQKTENTTFRKGHYGWTGETSLKIGNQDWQITTMKRHSGLISSTAQAVQGREDGSFMYTPLEDKQISLLSVKKVATESAIRLLHFEALAKFDAINEAGELPESSVYEIKPGQLLRFEGYGCFMELKYVVYDLCKGNFGTQLKCIDLIKKEFCVKDARIKPVSEKFGTGTYYNEGEVMQEDELNNLVIEVMNLTKQKAEEEAERQRTKEEERQTALEKGREIIPAIPDGVKAIIVANYMIDDSDIQTDYFASHSEKTVYLAFSGHKMNAFNEMAAACLNYVETMHLTDGEERRENYTGGEGYYLGSKYKGWKVSKSPISLNGSYGVTLEDLQLAAGEGRYFIPDIYSNKEAAGQLVKDEIQFVDYSEKAIALIGNTKQIKDILKECGGKFNPHLKCGAGWIFAKSKLDILEKKLGQLVALKNAS